ncbi:DUF397 domain-containing protein [Actinomadura monticuli]|uniref:DUF397 domain-containing protein n=1 Tax=Actinomadura monticuli TaxID=3097367 RepID=A0ABV4QBZ5_9ACTN
MEVSTMGLSRVTWRKARSSANNGSCVEVGSWHKNGADQEGHGLEIDDRWVESRRDSQQGSCVEIPAGEVIALARDSKDPDGPVLCFGADAWSAFLTTVKTGHFDLR